LRAVENQPPLEIFLILINTFMMKILRQKLLSKIFIAAMLLASCTIWSQGSETFDNIPTNSGSNYNDRTWTGDGGIDWIATAARTSISDTYAINGQGVGIRQGYLENTSLITGGIGTLTFKYRRLYSGVDSGGIKVYVNNVQVGETLYLSTSNIDIFTFSEAVNVSEDVTIRIDYSTGTRRVVLDDLEWTAYVPSGPSISTTTASYGPFCNTITNDILVEYTPDTTNGSIDGTYTVQRSNENGVFPDDSSSNLLVTALDDTNEILATLPSGLTAGNYRVRVVNDSPEIQSDDDNGSDIVISAVATPVVTTGDNITDTTEAIIAGTISNEGCATITSYGIIYSTTSGFANVDGTSESGSDLSSGEFTVSLSSLIPNTTYYYKAWADNGTVGYSSESSFTTEIYPLNAPVATAATTVVSDSFTANWNASIDATGYRLDVSTTDFSGTPTYVSGYENLDVSNVTSYNVTGLSQGVTYYYRVRAENTALNALSSNSNTIEVTTPVTEPFLEVTDLNDFGSICINTSSTVENSFIISGENLTTDDVVIGSITGYTFSSTSDGTYTNTLNITPEGDGTILSEVYVIFTPTNEISYDGNISITGGGTAGINVAVTGTGINTAPTVVTGVASDITVVEGTVAGQITEGCATITNYGIEYSTTNGFTSGTGTQLEGSNLSGSDYTVTISNLNPCTTYYYKSYAISGGVTTFDSTQQSFTTDSIATTTASITSDDITETSFTANWTAVEGANGYYLDVSDSSSFGTGSYASNLFISEYGEGSSGSKKYIEIYNGTGQDVDLSNYRVWRISNGGDWTEYSLSLSGTLADGETYVIGNNSGDVPGATIYNTIVSHNGDDAMGLAWNGGSGNSYTILDAVGTDGSDPGQGWDVAGVSKATKDRILIRKSSVNSPNTDWEASRGTNTSNSEWIVSSFTYSSTSQTTDLGSHTMDGGFTSSFITGYENLDVSNVTSYDVSDLDNFSTYYYRVRAYADNCSTGDSNVVTVNTKGIVTWADVGGTLKWTPEFYHDGTTPVVVDQTIPVSIEADYNTTTNGNLECKTLTMEDGLFVVAEGTTLVVKGQIISNNGAENFIVENNANILQIDEINNNGNVRVQRNSSLLYRLDYTLWSSPVRGQNLQEFSPMTMASRFYDYSEATDVYSAIDPSTNSFEEGLGYLIRMPNDHIDYVDAGTPGTAWTGTFEGIPLNGTINVNVTTANNGYNLIGNPYPSPINIHDFYTANSANLNGSSALYFWRKRNDASSSSYATVTMAAYTSNNQTGGFGDTGSGVFIGDPTAWVINSGQGFFVQATGTTITFDNSMRKNINNGQFFRSSQENNEEELEISRLWINLTGNSGEFSQMAVAYSNATTNNLDYGWDGKALIGDGPINIYSTLLEDKLAIQARAAFNDNDVVTLGYNAAEAGNYTISLDHVDGLFLNDQDIFLTDNVTGETVNLRDIDYMFTTEAGQINDRFEVSYNYVALSNPDFTLNNNNIVVFAKNNAITINSNNLEINEVNVYDTRGRLLFTKENLNTSEVIINELQSQQQMLIVNITTNKGTISKKVIF